MKDQRQQNEGNGIRQPHIEGPGPVPLPGIEGPYRPLHRGPLHLRRFRRPSRQEGRTSLIPCRVQRRIGGPILQHGPADRPGLLQLDGLILQQPFLLRQCLGQLHLARLHGPDGLHRHIQLPQQADLFQRLHVLVRVDPVVVGASLGMQQALLFIVPDVGAGDAQLLLDLPDIHPTFSFRPHFCLYYKG